MCAYLIIDPPAEAATESSDTLQPGVHLAFLAAVQQAGSHDQTTARFEPAGAIAVQTGFDATAVDTVFAEQHTARTTVPVTEQLAPPTSSPDDVFADIGMDALDDDLLEDLALATL